MHRIARILAIASLAILANCGRPPNDASSASRTDSQASFAFWQAIHAPYLSSRFVRDFAEIAKGDPVSIQKSARAVRLMVNASRANCARISFLKLLNVDPVLTKYTVVFLATRREGEQVAEELASVLENQVTMPDRAFTGVLMLLAKHAGDRSDFGWNVAKDALAEGSNGFGNMQSRQQAVVTRLRQMSDRAGAHDTLELEVRAKLTQTYSREFPASGSFPRFFDFETK